MKQIGDGQEFSLSYTSGSGGEERGGRIECLRFKTDLAHSLHPSH